MVEEITFGDPIVIPETIFVFSCIFLIFMVYHPQTDRHVKIFAAQPQTEFDSYLLLNVNIKHQVLGSVYQEQKVRDSFWSRNFAAVFNNTGRNSA